MVIIIIVLVVVLSGVLSTARNLDRETNAQYSLQITTTDGGGKASYSNDLLVVYCKHLLSFLPETVPIL